MKKSTNSAEHVPSTWEQNRLLGNFHRQTATIKKMMELSGMSRQVCGDYLYLTIAAIKAQLLDGIEVNLPSLGTFIFARQPGRTVEAQPESTNPLRRYGYSFPDGLRLKFAASQDVKSAVRLLKAVREYRSKPSSYAVKILKKPSQVELVDQQAKES